MFRWPGGPQSPVVFTAPPTADDIVRAVNSNTAPIRQLDTDNASLAVAGYPPLRATLALERPRKLRLRASLIGEEVDVGSNDDLFWMWIKRNPEPALFFARHDRYAQSPARQVLPIDPSWLAEALGVVQLDPLSPYEGPLPAGRQRVELRTRIPSPQGELTRTYIVDDQYGWVLEQRLYDPRGQLIAQAIATQHRYYPESNVSLPQRVELKMPSAQLELTFTARSYRINQLNAPDQMWALPQMEGTPLVDVADPRVVPASTTASPGPSASIPARGPASSYGGMPAPTAMMNPPPAGPPPSYAQPGTGYGPGYGYAAPEVSSQMPRYRGYTERR